MRLPENLIEYVREEALKLDHGRIIIEINASSGKLDVTTECRERFWGEKRETPPFDANKVLEERARKALESRKALEANPPRKTV